MTRTITLDEYRADMVAAGMHPGRTIVVKDDGSVYMSISNPPPPESTAQRIARLREMAKRVVSQSTIFAWDGDEIVWSSKGLTYFHVAHPRALDMLESALRAALSIANGRDPEVDSDR